MQIWIVRYGDNGDFKADGGAWTDRDAAFKKYTDTVAGQLSTEGIRAAAIDYNPGKDLHVEGRYGDWVSLESLDVIETEK